MCCGVWCCVVRCGALQLCPPVHLLAAAPIVPASLVIDEPYLCIYVCACSEEVVVRNGVIFST